MFKSCNELNYLFSLIFEFIAGINVLASVHYGGMLAVSEQLTDLLILELKLLSADIHGNITRIGYLGTSELGSKLIWCQIVIVGYGVDDDLRSEIFLLIWRDDRNEDLMNILDRKIAVS